MQTQSTKGTFILGKFAAAMRQNLPQGISPRYFDGFLKRNGQQMISVIDAQLALAKGVKSQKNSVPQEKAPELWTAGQRTKANLKAMALAAQIRPEKMTPQDRQALALYSGWGGLSINKVASQFPAGFPVPETRGLIHEYYTPSKVVNEIARAITPLLPSLERNGKILALEPAAGIGRFLSATHTPAFKKVDWTVVEWSQLSARMLQAMRPDLRVYNAPFERWISLNEADFTGKISLILSNPPYGPRGAAIAEDTVRSYREKKAYAYFLRRSLDLLTEGGLGVFLVPAGFLSGQSKALVSLRKKVLLRHHLATAYRLPSGIFPGANLVTDLLFFRARGGALPEVDAQDRFILDGRYFEDFQSHILGKEVGKTNAADDQTKKPRWGYEVVGEFTKLPDLVERPLCSTCVIPAPATVKRTKKAQGLSRNIEKSEALPKDLEDAESLGLRVDTYLKLASSGDSLDAANLYPELLDALKAWTASYGNAWRHNDLITLSKTSTTASRFLSAWTQGGKLIKGLQKAPNFIRRYRGETNDVFGLADHLYRQHRVLKTADLRQEWNRLGWGRKTGRDLVDTLLQGDWAIVGGQSSAQLVPYRAYLTGELWPKLDKAREDLETNTTASIKASLTDQINRLTAIIKPVVYEDIEDISPQAGWIPLDLLTQWFIEEINSNSEVKLERIDGLLTIGNYDTLSDRFDLTAEALRVIGWINHDRTYFRPKKRKREDNVDELRLLKAKEWQRKFGAWISTELARKDQVEEAYNRKMRGYIPPIATAEPLNIARWNGNVITLHPHQVAGARRILANRGGLLAFDVGVGKSFAGCAVIAKARQEGWSRRPVVLVPNSIIWKWVKDFKTTLPDYRVAVIGSKLTTISRGPRKGLKTSVTDTPEERATKWTRFQAGEYDVVLLTYTALGRTRMNEVALRAYAEKTEAIQREVRLRQRNAEKSKGKLSERQEALLKEGVAAWIAEKLELPESWQYDPGIAWDDIGIDMLVIDEAQNFKNLYMPEPREGGVPRFMGNAGAGSNRAWQLDFRCASVRQKTGGAGIVLLSATPAKNSPLEFYNLIQLIDHEAWSRRGIHDPEAFIDRYLQIEMKGVLDTRMQMVTKSAVTGFKNLDELRDVIFRYSEFQTAEDVGLKLPDTIVEMVEVDMDDLQESAYDVYVGLIEQAMQSEDPKDRGQILGYLARMALVSVHGSLDQGFKWKTAASSGIDPHSPKFDACAERVLANRHCGHIIFVENLAAHQWMREVLIESGIPKNRIAVLNAKTAKAAADRQRIAQHFNGDSVAGIPPKYDVVIANQIAYEGIDLQTRTCAIHHLDLPWEPATLQQRNGRGVRQGNVLANISIFYYFARRSQDGLRFNLIQGKLGWMTQLIKSTARNTNNPAAQMDMGTEEIMLLISRDPEKTQALLDELRVKREAIAKKKVVGSAIRLMRQANARFRRAERTIDPHEIARIRAEGEELIADIVKLDPTAWPWAACCAEKVRIQRVFIASDGAPVWEGLKAQGPNQGYEFGVEQGTHIAVRAANSARWYLKGVDDIGAFGLCPEHHSTPVQEDEGRLIAAFKGELYRISSGNWDDVIGYSSDFWRSFVWSHLKPEILKAISKSQYRGNGEMIPGILGGKFGLHLAQWVEGANLSVLPPTLAGWNQFLEALPKSEEKYRDLVRTARFWWGRKIPRSIVIFLKDKAEKRKAA